MAYAALIALNEAEAQIVAEAAFETFRPNDRPVTDAFAQAAAEYRRNRDRRAA